MWIAILLRTVNTPLMGTQIALSAIAVAIASSIKKGSLMERMMEAQEQAKEGSVR